MPKKQYLCDKCETPLILVKSSYSEYNGWGRTYYYVDMKCPKCNKEYKIEDGFRDNPNFKMDDVMMGG